LLVQPPWSIQIGSAVFSNTLITEPTKNLLPLEPQFILGCFRKNYRMLVSRFPVRDSDKKLVAVNIHLAAFDKDADIRKKQLQTLKDFISSEYQKGNYVIAGGDWNLRLSDTDFHHTTDQKYLFWVFDLPGDFTPEGWKWAVDPDTPSVRTAHKPYVKGENYTCIIDGFLASPNITITDVSGIDLGFEFTDHHPVKIQIELDTE
jgi:endonuclease/exonuclease/phosphatase family metal-dependent hydrolase